MAKDFNNTNEKLPNPVVISEGPVNDIYLLLNFPTIFDNKRYSNKSSFILKPSKAIRCLICNVII